MENKARGWIIRPQKFLLSNKYVKYLEVNDRLYTWRFHHFEKERVERIGKLSLFLYFALKNVFEALRCRL